MVMASLPGVSPHTTLKDVAERAGVHPGTASRALNPQTKALVNPETASRVLEAAEVLGYRPNPFARSLKTKHSYDVGILIPDMTNPFFPPIVRGVEDRLAESGYTVFVGNTDNLAERERSQLQEMRARQVDGLIVATAQLKHKALSEAMAAGTPIVLVNRTFARERVFSVSVDDVSGVRMAVEHLVGLGHKHIAHVGGPQHLSTGRNRYRGFVQAMEASGLEIDPDRVAFANSFTEEGGIVAFGKLLKTRKKITAVVAANDLIALGGYDVLPERKLRCPEDVSIVGFNDMRFVDKVRPPLTTIRVPQYEIGRLAADLLLDRLRDPEAAPRALRLTPELIVRGSTGPVAGRSPASD
jgi:LacI family transcriptional regulator